MFSFLLEVVNSLDSSLGQFTKASAPCRCCRVPIPTPSQPPAPPERLVHASRPSALELVPAAQLSSLMAMDSPLPPPSDLSPLLPTPTPCALDFAATITRPPPPRCPPFPYLNLAPPHPLPSRQLVPRRRESNRRPRHARALEVAGQSALWTPSPPLTIPPMTLAPSLSPLRSLANDGLSPVLWPTGPPSVTFGFTLG